MSDKLKKRGRPNKYKAFDELLASCPASGMRRPRYINGIGVRRGEKGNTVWIKVQIHKKPVTWKGRVYKPGQAIEYKLGSVTSFTWEKADALRGELQGRADRGEPLENKPSFTFKEWCEDWMSRKRGTLADWKLEQGRMRKIWLEFADYPLGDITTADIERWIAKMRKEGYAPGYIKRLLNSLRAVLNDAVDKKQLEQCPVTRTCRVDGAAKRTRFYNSAEIQKLLATAREHFDLWVHDFVLWALHSGMRRSEILNLTFKDVVELNGNTFINIIKTKSKKPRTIPCTEEMVRILERRKAAQENMQDTRVFPHSLSTWKRNWHSLRKKAEMEDLWFHDARRTHATISMIGNVDLRTIADRLGHTDLKMLQDHYAMVVGEVKLEAAKRFEDKFTEYASKVVTIKDKHTRNNSV